jgi:hypothetical protein
VPQKSWGTIGAHRYGTVAKNRSATARAHPRFQAADFIMKLPKAERDLEEWQTATGCLIGAAEGRDFMMHARIGVLRALNRNIERTLTDRKEMHWARGKLKRDQQ